MNDDTKEDAPAAAAVSIQTFCDQHDISYGMYFRLRRQGKAPTEMRIGNRTRISAEAAERWRRERTVPED